MLYSLGENRARYRNAAAARSGGVVHGQRSKETASVRKARSRHSLAGPSGAWREGLSEDRRAQDCLQDTRERHAVLLDARTTVRL